MRNQPPVHEPAIVAAPVTDNDGNVGGSLGGDIEAPRVLWQVAVKVPANPNVTKLEGSGDATTHKLSEVPINMDAYGSQPDRVT
jgi:hypothetical protein